MKRWLLFIVIVAACSTTLYFLIPAQMNVSSSVGIKVNAKAFSRTFLDDDKWKQWWIGDVAEVNRNSSYKFNNHVYTIVEKKLSSVVIDINMADTLRSEMVFIPENPDSVSLIWISKINLPITPIDRVQLYFQAKKLKKDFETIAQGIRSFYEQEENIYGIKIQKRHVVDSTLISTSASSKGYPTIENIYRLIDKLKAFAQQNGARQTGFPMLNITSSDSINFLTRVALPVDKKLKDEGDVVYRWMLGGGNILVTEVKGGLYKINNVFVELENYVRDHQRIAPAMPFQSLVTDRRKEPDTSKWITKVYWPVM